jgi:hypothetical protein
VSWGWRGTNRRLFMTGINRQRFAALILNFFFKKQTQFDRRQGD